MLVEEARLPLIPRQLVLRCVSLVEGFMSKDHQVRLRVWLLGQLTNFIDANQKERGHPDGERRIVLVLLREGDDDL